MPYRRRKDKMKLDSTREEDKNADDCIGRIRKV